MGAWSSGCNKCDDCQPPPPPPAPAACVAASNGPRQSTSERVLTCGCHSSIVPRGAEVCFKGRDLEVSEIIDDEVELTGKGLSGTFGVDWCVGAWIYFAHGQYMNFKWTARDEITVGSCKHTPAPTTPAPPTPAPPTPAPAPPGPNCMAWCAVNTKPWSEKCAWGENCHECNSCQAPVVEPSHCRNECYENTLSWKKKCGQEMGGDITLAEKCKKCPECPLFPSSCTQHWGVAGWAFPPTDYCGGTRAPTAAPTPATPTPAPPTPAPATTVYSIALCPDYAPSCGSGNAPSASVGDTCTSECKEHGNAWFCFVGDSDVKWGWCAQQQVCTAIDSTATDAWCMSSCNHIPSHCPASHCKCTATTAAPPTAAPSTAVPAPTPPSPNCLSWCVVNANPWSEKCAWGASCNECDDCTRPAPPTPAPPTESNPNCKSWCAKDTRPWTQKCKWTSTCACSECP